MSKHKSEDYKISAVKYYLNNDISLDDVFVIFDCFEQSLYRWVKRYGKPTDIKKELKVFYKEISKYSLNKIISLDETSISPALIMEYSKCSLGKRCVVKTDDNYVFRKFTLLCAISNSKCVGATLYKEGGMTKEKFVEFLEANIFNKYKNHLIILDNAGSYFIFFFRKI